MLFARNKILYLKYDADVLPLYNLVMANVTANIFMNSLFQQMEQHKLLFCGRYSGHLIGYNLDFPARCVFSWRSLIDAWISFFFFSKQCAERL